MTQLYYTVDWTQPDNDFVQDQHFGQDRNKAIQFARRKSQSIKGMAYVIVEDAATMTQFGRIAYSNGFRDHTVGQTA